MPFKLSVAFVLAVLSIATSTVQAKPLPQCDTASGTLMCCKITGIELVGLDNPLVRNLPIPGGVTGQVGMNCYPNDRGPNNDAFCPHGTATCCTSELDVPPTAQTIAIGCSPPN